MRSGISCFNGPLFKKNMTRFWPIWSLYTLIWAFMIPLQFLVLSSRHYTDGRMAQALLQQARQVAGMLGGGVVISAVFGLMAAMAVFSYLYSSRSACMMHSLPMDRNTLFATNYFSGLAFLLLPNLAVFLLTLAVEAAYGCLSMQELVTWFWVQSATALFFYSFAVLCAMATGNLLALPIFYGVLNMLVYVVSYLLSEVLSLFLYGYCGLGNGLERAVEWCTPMIKLSDACRWSYPVDEGGNALAGTLGSASAVAVYAAVGAALAVCSLLLYQRRHVESAGDVVAVPLLRPLFRYGVALCTGLCLGACTAAVLDIYSCLPVSVLSVLWAVAGYFVAEMLLRKSFRVLDRWKGAVVLACVLSLLFTAATLDWFGFERKVPQAGQVASVSLDVSNAGAPYDSAYYGAVTLERQEQIREVVALHQAIVDQRGRAEENGEDYFYVTLTYTMTDGRTLSRNYRSIPLFSGEEETPGSVTYAVRTLLSDRDYVRALYGLDEHGQDRLVGAHLDNLWSPEERMYSGIFYLDKASNVQLRELWEAVLQDFDEGTIGVRYVFDSDPQRAANTYSADLTFEWESTQQVWINGVESQKINGSTVSITLTPQASRTLAKLEELGVLGGEDGAVLYTHQEIGADGIAAAFVPAD